MTTNALRLSMAIVFLAALLWITIGQLFMTLAPPMAAIAGWAILGETLSLMAVQYTGAGIASTLMALSPVFILFPYAFIYKQRIKLREVLGVVVSMAGVALFFLL